VIYNAPHPRMVKTDSQSVFQVTSISNALLVQTEE